MQLLGIKMAQNRIPHFHNNPGVASVTIGTKEFMCMGATSPHDHPHVYLDMGDENEIICPYCSTLFKFDPFLSATQANPPECADVHTQAA
jgi:uncharacterized Zn-finger protein